MIARQAQIDHLQLSSEANKGHHETIMALYIARATERLQIPQFDK